MTVREVAAQFPKGFHPGCKQELDEASRDVVSHIHRVIKHTMKKAPERGIGWELGSPDEAFEYLFDLYHQQGGRCAISGFEFEFGTQAEYAFNLTPSLDRRDPNQGYSKENVQWVLRSINYAKSNLPQQIFENICRGVANSAGRSSPAALAA